MKSCSRRAGILCPSGLGEKPCKGLWVPRAWRTGVSGDAGETVESDSAAASSAPGFSGDTEQDGLISPSERGERTLDAASDRGERILSRGSLDILRLGETFAVSGNFGGTRYAFGSEIGRIGRIKLFEVDVMRGMSVGRGGEWNPSSRETDVEVVRGKPVGRGGDRISSINDMRDRSRSKTRCGVMIWSKLECDSRSVRSEPLVSRETGCGEQGSLSPPRPTSIGDAKPIVGLW